MDDGWKVTNKNDEVVDSLIGRVTWKKSEDLVGKIDMEALGFQGIRPSMKRVDIYSEPLRGIKSVFLVGL